MRRLLLLEASNCVGIDVYATLLNFSGDVNCIRSTDPQSYSLKAPHFIRI